MITMCILSPDLYTLCIHIFLSNRYAYNYYLVIGVCLCVGVGGEGVCVCVGGDQIRISPFITVYE